jgi:hypothetical protein
MVFFCLFVFGEVFYDIIGGIVRHYTYDDIYGHEQIRILSPFTLFTRATVGQNFPRLFTHYNGYAAYYRVNLCGHF